MCIGDYLRETAGVRRAGDNPSRFGRDGGTNGFLLRRNIATVEGGTKHRYHFSPPGLSSFQKELEQSCATQHPN